MVNLSSPFDQQVRAVGERGSNRQSRYSRFQRRRQGETMEPKGLLELEALAVKAVSVMRKHNAPQSTDYTIVMDLLRAQYNMNFVILCERCGGKHDNDELLAPER
ncbi:hypothetical protein ACJJTC_002798 [Scirpophaga incertulas]